MFVTKVPLTVYYLHFENKHLTSDTQPLFESSSCFDSAVLKSSHILPDRPCVWGCQPPEVLDTQNAAWKKILGDFSRVSPLFSEIFKIIVTLGSYDSVLNGYFTNKVFDVPCNTLEHASRIRSSLKFNLNCGFHLQNQIIDPSSVVETI